MNKYIILALLAAVLLISGCGETCFKTVGTSSEVPAHVHNWCKGVENTGDLCNSQGICHSHKVNSKENLAEPAGNGPHTHKLKE